MDKKEAFVIIDRFWQDSKQTLSTCTVLGANNMPLFSSIALERGWRNNKQDISCIPALFGPYPLVLEWSNAFNTFLWEIKDVPNRSECKFHTANFWHQLRGCISLGRRPIDMDKDGYLDVTDSGDTMKDFHKVLKDFDKVTVIFKTAPNVH